MISDVYYRHILAYACIYGEVTLIPLRGLQFKIDEDTTVNVTHDVVMVNDVKVFNRGGTCILPKAVEDKLVNFVDFIQWLNMEPCSTRSQEMLLDGMHNLQVHADCYCSDANNEKWLFIAETDKGAKVLASPVEGIVVTKVSDNTYALYRYNTFKHTWTEYHGETYKEKEQHKDKGVPSLESVLMRLAVSESTDAQETVRLISNALKHVLDEGTQQNIRKALYDNFW